MNRALFIYDNTGKIYHWSIGEDIIVPDGLQYIIIEDYDFSKRAIERIDVSQVPHVPIYSKTKEEQIIEDMTLDEYKDKRQIENKKALADFLKSNPLLWTDEYYYGVTEEDQNEMSLDLSTYQLKKALGDTEWKLQWHSIKSNCRDFTLEEFNSLLNAIIDFVYPYRQLEMEYKESIYSASSKEEVASINLVYELNGVLNE